MADKHTNYITAPSSSTNVDTQIRLFYKAYRVNANTVRVSIDPHVHYYGKYWSSNAAACFLNSSTGKALNKNGTTGKMNWYGTSGSSTRTEGKFLWTKDYTVSSSATTMKLTLYFCNTLGGGAALSTLYNNSKGMSFSLSVPSGTTSIGTPGTPVVSNPQRLAKEDLCEVSWEYASDGTNNAVKYYDLYVAVYGTYGGQGQSVPSKKVKSLYDNRVTVYRSDIEKLFGKANTRFVPPTTKDGWESYRFWVRAVGQQGTKDSGWSEWYKWNEQPSLPSVSESTFSPAPKKTYQGKPVLDAGRKYEFLPRGSKDYYYPKVSLDGPWDATAYNVLEPIGMPMEDFDLSVVTGTDKKVALNQRIGQNWFPGHGVHSIVFNGWDYIPEEGDPSIHYGASSDFVTKEYYIGEELVPKITESGIQNLFLKKYLTEKASFTVNPSLLDNSVQLYNTTETVELQGKTTGGWVSLRKERRSSSGNLNTSFTIGNVFSLVLSKLPLDFGPNGKDDMDVKFRFIFTVEDDPRLNMTKEMLGFYKMQPFLYEFSLINSDGNTNYLFSLGQYYPITRNSFSIKIKQKAPKGSVVACHFQWATFDGGPFDENSKWIDFKDYNAPHMLEGTGEEAVTDYTFTWDNIPIEEGEVIKIRAVLETISSEAKTELAKIIPKWSNIIAPSDRNDNYIIRRYKKIEPLKFSSQSYDNQLVQNNEALNQIKWQDKIVWNDNFGKKVYQVNSCEIVDSYGFSTTQNNLNIILTTLGNNGIAERKYDNFFTVSNIQSNERFKVSQLRIFDKNYTPTGEVSPNIVNKFNNKITYCELATKVAGWGLDQLNDPQVTKVQLDTLTLSSSFSFDSYCAPSGTKITGIKRGKIV